ncbi:Nitrogen permease reactivator protein [Rhinocladiella similis]
MRQFMRQVAESSQPRQTDSSVVGFTRSGDCCATDPERSTRDSPFRSSLCWYAMKAVYESFEGKVCCGSSTIIFLAGLWKLKQRARRSRLESGISMAPRPTTTIMAVVLLLFCLECIFVDGKSTPASPHDHYPNLGLFGQFLEPIAKGATGDVVLFEHNDTMRRYAVKAFVRNHIPEYDEEYNRDVREEFDVARRLEHGHIVETYDLIFDPVSHRWYMPMQYCPDILSRRIRAAFSVDGSMNQDANAVATRDDSQSRGSSMSCIFGQLLEGINHMHDRGITHGDLKPNNIGIDELGQVRVLDFGISFQTLDMLTREKRLQWAKADVQITHTALYEVFG